MYGVEEAVKVAATPSHRQNEFSIQPAKDAAERPDRHAIYLASLEQRDLSLAQTDAFAEVSLTPRRSMAERSADPADAQVIHFARL